MPEEIAGHKADVERLHDSIDVLLYHEQNYLFLHVQCTGSVIQALVAFRNLHQGYKEKEIDVSVAKDVQYLEAKQHSNGSWYGYWGICFLYGTYFALSGLASVGNTYNNSEAVRKGVQFFLSTQNEEGGWGESLDSCPTEKFVPLEDDKTNLVQTSWAMLGLIWKVLHISGS
ncbi:hypothetical protein POM88_011096 [Heracleum sosnowskyi]|uniref:Squalene cyclase C-terminal domain-containing protein n=1 Tax=Heracleum sosnowskyi TaxID=360622 RepID=A0AAD8MW92_9APIA|nr:hypothetical protein POM88_011096 [Heracleum sosnowskyi]